VGGTPHNALAPRGLSRGDAAAYVGVSPNTFDRLVEDGTMPGPMQFYSRKVWDLRRVDAALDRLAPLGTLPPQPETSHAADWD